MAKNLGAKDLRPLLQMLSLQVKQVKFGYVVRPSRSACPGLGAERRLSQCSVASTGAFHAMRFPRTVPSKAERRTAGGEPHPSEVALGRIKLTWLQIVSFCWRKGRPQSYQAFLTILLAAPSARES